MPVRVLIVDFISVITVTYYEIIFIYNIKFIENYLRIEKTDHGRFFS